MLFLSEEVIIHENYTLLTIFSEFVEKIAKLYRALLRHLKPALLPHWLNMELHLQSLFGLHVHSLVTNVLIG